MKLEFIVESKNKINHYLNHFFNEKKQVFKSIQPWGVDTLERIEKFTTGGKMIRGALILLSNSFFARQNQKNALLTAAAMELVQTSLLIHDDIMDSDFSRRGEKTIFYQYKEAGEREKIKNAYHFGEAMGICVGDIGFFLAYEILAGLEIESQILQKLLALFSAELSLVGLGQMKDLHSGMSLKDLSEDEIDEIYRYKTARYTFSLPLMLGAVLASADEEILYALAQLGETIGIIFQIIDDEMGLFGSEAVIGKPVGSDIKEKKQTLYYYYLNQTAKTQDLKKIKKIFGNPKITAREIEWVREKVREYQIPQRINDKLEKLAHEAERIIEALKVGKEQQQILKDLLQFNLKRKQ